MRNRLRRGERLSVGSSTPAGTLLNAHPAALSAVPLTIVAQVATVGMRQPGRVGVAVRQRLFGDADSPLVGIAGASPQTYAFSPPALAVQGAGSANLAAYDSALNIALSTWDAGTSMWEVQFSPPASTSAILSRRAAASPASGTSSWPGSPVSLAAVPATVFADSHARSPQGRNANGAGKVK